MDLTLIVYLQVQQLADPEATESSSGGDSCDEQDPSPPGAVLFAPLQERAAYQWFSNRAQLASQWVWLQAQVRLLPTLVTS